MRYLIITLIAGLLVLPATSIAQDETGWDEEQLELRSDLFDFLKEEGFVPELDSDGDIKFKSEGQNYYISVSKTDDNPMYVSFFRIFNYPDEYSIETLVMATMELNRYKGVKVVCFESSFRIAAELFVRNAEPIKSAFYKLKNLIDSVKSDVLDECEKIGPVASSGSAISTFDIPFIITDMEVANVDYNGKIIQDYGSTIYDFKTKYLQPRITIRPIKKSGNYTVFVKLYKDNVLQRNTTTSPEDCTFSYTITINGSTSQIVELSGWGSNNAGQWPIGSYRFEIWYNNYCIGSKKFKVI